MYVILRVMYSLKTILALVLAPTAQKQARIQILCEGVSGFWRSLAPKRGTV